MKSTTIIGSGFAGLAAACELANEGVAVTLLEKNETLGGRARKFSADGFLFDMGPSWYWMPDVFESFFSTFGKSASDYYELIQLDPGFQMIFDQNERLALPADRKMIDEVFEKIEKGASKKLAKFLNESKRKYQISMKEFIHLPSLHLKEFAKLSMLKAAFQLDLLKGFDRYVDRFFEHPHLKALMEFPVLFLGAKPSKIPAMYSMMNYAAIEQGTWYPMGGMHKIIEGFVTLAQELGVQIHTNSEVISIHESEGTIKKIKTKDAEYKPDTVIAACDYHHFDSLLSSKSKNYSEQYWQKRTMSPSCLIFYMGVDKKLPRLQHHNLFFDTDFDLHAHEIYDQPAWPTNPQFYVCCPSKTDDSVAPVGKENLFFLMPLAPGLEDSQKNRELYFDLLIKRVEKWIGLPFREEIIYKKSYCINDFKKDYHAFKGNAYGLANTLDQTAVLKPKMRNKNLQNLWYAGQLTVPGPGMPPAIISGRIAAQEVLKHMHLNR